MGDAYRGLTIQLKADGTKVMTTLRSMTRAAGNVESELRRVKKALRFDGSDGRAAANQLKLMAENAALARAQAITLRKQLDTLGDKMVGGKRMKDWAASIKDVATETSLMKARATEASTAIAKMRTQLNEAWAANKRLNSQKNPFATRKSWESLSREEIRGYIETLRQAGGITDAEATRMKNAIGKLKDEFMAADAKAKQLGQVEAYVSAGRKLDELGAKARAMARDMADASLAMKATGFERPLERARAELARTSSEAEKLKRAMREAPQSLDAFNAYASASREKLNALNIEARELRAEISSLRSERGISALAADGETLQNKMAASARNVDRLSAKLTEARGKEIALAEAANKAEIALADAGGRGSAENRELAERVDAANAQLREQKQLVNAIQHEWDQADAAQQSYNKAARLRASNSALAANRAQAAAIASSTARNARMVGSSALTSLGMSMYTTIQPIAMMGMAYGIQAADEVDAAYRDMRKTVEGTEEDFERLRKAALDFGDTHYTSADMILEFEAMGGQLGIQVENLEAFADTVAHLSIATNMDSDDIALDLGKMANIMHLNVDEYERFADSLVRLGNSEPALESDIMAITARFAGMATIVDMAPDQILAIATAATATGQKAEAAGGSLQRILGRMEGAVAGVSDGMRKMMEESEDFSEEDIEALEGAQESLQAYADIAGMTAEEFANAWEKDAAGAFQSFVNGLKRYAEGGGSVDNYLWKTLGIGSIRDRQLLEGLTNTTDVLADSLSMSKNAFEGVSDQYGAAGDAAREAQRKQEGFSGQLQIMKNNGQHLAAVLGESVAPAIGFLNGVLSEGVNFYEDAGAGFQALTMALSGLGIAAGPVLTMSASIMATMDSLRVGVAEYTSVEQTMGRVNATAASRGRVLSQAYLKQSGQLSVVNTQLERNRRLQAAGHTMLFGQDLKTQERALAGQAATLEKKMAGTSKLMAVRGMLGGVATGVGIVAVIALLEQFGAAIFDAMEKSENFHKATDGLTEVASKLRSATDGAAQGVESLDAAFSAGGKSIAEYKKEADQVTAEIAELQTTMENAVNSALSDSASADFWGKRMTELSEGFQVGSAADLFELQDAVKQYNDLTGSNVEIVNELTGALNANTNEILSNTEAYKAAAMEKAFATVAADAAAAEAKAISEISVQQKQMKENWGERAAIIKEAGGEESKLNAEQRRRVETLDRENNELASNVQKLMQERDAAEELKDAAYDQVELRAKEAATAKEVAEAEREAAKSIEAYNKQMGDGKFEEMASQLGVADAEMQGFADKLYTAGIDANMLGTVGADAFIKLKQQADEAGAGMDAVYDAMFAISSLKLDPGSVSINLDGLTEVEGHILDLQNKQIDGKTFSINADTSQIEAADEQTRALLAELGLLGQTVANPSVSVSVSGVDALSSIKSMLDNMPRDVLSTVTVLTKKVFEGGQAAGGINGTLLRQIPAHADGMLSGIATRAILTNQGLVGEDGAEAILRMGRQSAVVPLTNTRYVRPFARAVASEMGGAGGNVTQIHNHYSVGNMELAQGSDGAIALEALFKAIRVSKAS